MINPVRSILSVLGGFVLFQVLTQLLELPLVAFVGGGPPQDEATYLAVRNQTMVLGARVGYTIAAGLLAGYMSAKVAGVFEIRHALGAAALVTGQLLMEFTTQFAPPLWTRAALLLVAGPSMLLGAWVRASAAAVTSSAADEDGAVSQTDGDRP